MEMKAKIAKETAGTVVYSHDVPKGQQGVVALYVHRSGENGKEILTDEGVSASAVMHYEGDSIGGAMRIFAVDTKTGEVFGRKVYFSKIDELVALGDSVKMTIKVSKKSKVASSKNEGKFSYERATLTVEAV